MYYTSIDKTLSELELRFSGNDQEILCALGNICHSEPPDRENFPRVAKFYKIDGEILKAEQKMYARFRRVRGLGYMTVPEMLETKHENDLYMIYVSSVFYCGTYPLSDTCYIVFCRTTIQCVARIENSPPQHQRATTCQLHRIY